MLPEMQASVISALGMDINEVEPASAEIVGDNVPIAQRVQLFKLQTANAAGLRGKAPCVLLGI